MNIKYDYQKYKEIYASDSKPDLLSKMRCLKLPDNFLLGIPVFDAVREYSKEVEIDFEIGFNLALALSSSLYADKFKIEVKEGHVEYLVLWSISFVNSGGGKTAIYNKIINPYKNYQRQTKNRIIANNTTAEALIDLLSKNKEKIIISTDEGMNFLSNIVGGKYSSGSANDADINNFFNGGSVAIDRKGQEETTFIQEGLLILAIMVQTRVFDKMKNKNHYMDGGLGARVLNYIGGEKKLKKFDYYIPDKSVVQKYEQFVFDKLSEEVVQNDLGEREYKLIKFSSKVSELAKSYRKEINKLSIDENDYVAEYSSKLEVNFYRIIGVLHCLKNSGNELSEICEDTVEEAKIIIDYYINSFYNFISLSALNYEDERAKNLFSFLRGGYLEFYYSEIWQNKKDHKGYYNKSEKLKEIIKILEDRKYIIRVDARPEKYRINSNLV